MKKLEYPIHITPMAMMSVLGKFTSCVNPIKITLLSRSFEKSLFYKISVLVENSEHILCYNIPNQSIEWASHWLESLFEKENLRLIEDNKKTLP